MHVASCYLFSGFHPVSRAHQHTCQEQRTALADCALRSGCNYTGCREGGTVPIARDARGHKTKMDPSGWVD